MMDLGAMVGGESKSQQLREFGSAYGLLADVATTLCPADILSLVREEKETPVLFAAVFHAEFLFWCGFLFLWRCRWIGCSHPVARLEHPRSLVRLDFPPPFSL